MSINKNNYEEYFLDYHEGRLNTEEIAELMIFLVQNPLLDDEINAFDKNVTFESEQIDFNFKDRLKQIPNQDNGINDGNFEINCIANLEGDLDAEKTILFNQYLQVNPEKTKVVELFKKTKITPDSKIEFPNKGLLKRFIVKKGNKLRALYPTISVAATILLFVILFSSTNNVTAATYRNPFNMNLLDTSLIDKIKDVILNYNRDFIPKI